jgi:hypothetical protein
MKYATVSIAPGVLKIVAKKSKVFSDSRTYETPGGAVSKDRMGEMCQSSTSFAVSHEDKRNSI